MTIHNEHGDVIISLENFVHIIEVNHNLAQRWRELRKQVKLVIDNARHWHPEVSTAKGFRKVDTIMNDLEKEYP